MLENRPNSFDDCLVYGRTKFEKYFTNKILQLLYNFPLDMTTKEGTPFWSGAKRYVALAYLSKISSSHLDNLEGHLRPLYLIQRTAFT